MGNENSKVDEQVKNSESTENNNVKTLENSAKEKAKNKKIEKSDETEYVSYEVDFKKVNTKKMSLQQIEEIRNEIEKVHLNFVKMVDDVDIAAENYRVLLILGENELIYDTGEFYIGETLNDKVRKKISRKQAQSIFVDYYVRHHLEADVKEKIENKVKEQNIQKEQKVKDEPKKEMEVKGIAAEILEKRKQELEKNNVIEKKEVEEELELM